jgi:hypothetical protein
MPFEKIGKLYLVTGVTDLRKGIDGYAALIQSQLHQSPMDHSMYLFCNRDRTKLKCLYFDSTGGYVGDSDPPRRFLWYRVDGSAGTTSSGSGTTSTDFGTTIVG